MFEINLIMFWFHLDLFIDICGLPDQYKKGSWHKIEENKVPSDFDWKSIAPSRGDLRWPSPPPLAYRQNQEFLNYFLFVYGLLVPH